MSVCAHLSFDIFLPVFFHTVLDIFCLLGNPVYIVCPYHCPDYFFFKNLPAPPYKSNGRSLRLFEEKTPLECNSKICVLK